MEEEKKEDVREKKNKENINYENHLKYLQKKRVYNNNK